ncbi:MAG: hypothetical protein OXG05_16065 [Gammaproteobacteria bacterium]|nr:hypothetical protein [Gammaproteobacteria bacterium]
MTLNSDLENLSGEGFNIGISTSPKWISVRKLRDKNGMHIKDKYWHNPKQWLIIGNVPYTTRRDGKLVRDEASMVMPIWFCGGRTTKPKEHWALWLGNHPIKNGALVRHLITGEFERHRFVPEYKKIFLFSCEPSTRETEFRDYYDKATYYFDLFDPDFEDD